MDVSDLTPIIVGVGQTVSHWSGDEKDIAPSPLGLAVEATQNALSDVGVETKLRNVIDTVAFVRLNQDSLPTEAPAYLHCENLPGSLAEEIGIKEATHIYSYAGGDQPQKLVNEFAEKLFSGKTTAVLLSGAEALGAVKTARRNRIKLNWSKSSSASLEDRGSGPRMLTDFEIENGLGFPAQSYPIFDNAYRHRCGLDRKAYLQQVAELLAPFSKVAAKNPYAQFPAEHSVDFLATVSKDNFRLTDSYLKWHVAQDAVNQSASIILTTVKTARELGISEEKWIYIHGYAEADDLAIANRADYSKSQSIDLSIERAFSGADLKTSDISFFDIYSCFPSVVFIAAESLGLDWRKQNLSVTGGLPFFGGAGNNYSMHAIASMVETLRHNPKDKGLVLANGGFMTKHAVGIYSAIPKENWKPISSDDLQKVIADNAQEISTQSETSGKVETYTIAYGRSGPERGVAITQTSSGRKFARFQWSHRATLDAFLENEEPVSMDVSLIEKEDKQWMSAAAPIGSAEDDRAFKHILLNRRDRVLEITLNRPEAYNALMGPAHYELSEVFDEFERDQDLWCAIITGAGEKAFCSGNDLKATARGGDIRTPRSGFAGLCSRFNRTKPIISAINGVAMGGGLEIVLASDLAIADPSAKFALPEVKVGLFAAAGGLQRLTRQVTRKAAMELILTGRHFGAEEAKELGVINAVSAPGNVLQEAREIAYQILEASPSAVQASKRVLNDFDNLDYDLQASMKTGLNVFGDLMKTKDFNEGVTAFSEKRPPKWTNS